jgi:hypothetical protein
LTERLMAVEGDWSQAARKNTSPTVYNESVAQPNQSQQSISVQHCDVHPGGVHPEVNCRGPSTQYNPEDHDQRQRRPEVNHHSYVKKRSNDEYVGARKLWGTRKRVSRGG